MDDSFPRSTPGGATSPPVVMIVDDNLDNLTVLSGILRQGGYAVRPAISGALALASLALARPEAILLDVRMPDLDGYEVCRRLKADPRTAEIPVIFLSALHEVGSKLESFRAGAVDHIVKPFEPEEVLVRVGIHLELAAARRMLLERNAVLDRRVEKATERPRRLTTAQVLDIQEAERRRIARELHDQIGQVLAVIKIHLQAAEQRVGQPEQALHLKEGIRAVDAALPLVRNLALNLHPPQLDEIGLAAALRWLLDRQAQLGGFRGHFRAEEVPRLPRDLETACFRVAQEALTNVLRHAEARDVWIELHRDAAGAVSLAIRDNGRGFDAAAVHPGGHLGLVGMEERASLAGGRVIIESVPGGGTEIRAMFPVERSGVAADA
jgi:signal transduction histidine kinase